VKTISRVAGRKDDSRNRNSACFLCNDAEISGRLERLEEIGRDCKRSEEIGSDWKKSEERTRNGGMH
jgi:hypothetical protein